MVLLALVATLALGRQAGAPAPRPTGVAAQGAGSQGSDGGPKPRTFSPLSAVPGLRERRTPPPPPAIYGNWRSCQIGGGGEVGRVVYTSDPSVLYAYADLGGIYRSDDGGRRWRMLGGALDVQGSPAVRDLSVDPRDPNRVLALLGDQYSASQGLYETRDGGRTWRRLVVVRALGNGPLRWTGGLITRDPRDPRTILVGSAGDGIYRSADDGKSWRQIGAGVAEPNGALAGAYLTDLRFDRSDPRRVWAAASPTRAFAAETDPIRSADREYGGGWFRSEDGGRTWIRLDDRAPTEFVQDEARPERLIGIFDETGVRVSDDAGETWRPYAEGLPSSDDPSREPFLSDARFDALASGPGFQLLMTTRGTLYRRNTNETAWNQVPPEGTPQLYEGRPWIGQDGGSRGVGGESTGAQRFGAAASSLSIDPRDPGHLWFTDLTAVYESRDGGKNWNLAMDGIETGTVLSFESDPATPAVVHVGLAGDGFLTSRDGATAFELPMSLGSRIPGSRAGANTKSISTALWDPARLIASGDGGDGLPASNTVWLSADRGATWTRSPMTGLPNRRVHAINTVVWDPVREGRAYAAVGGPAGDTAGGLFVSTDGGLSWLRDTGGLPPETNLSVNPRPREAVSDESLFTRDLWTIGHEIALNGDGDLVLISRPRGETYRREAGASAGSFVRVPGNGRRDDRTPLNGAGVSTDRGIEGVPNDVVAAGTRKGAFFVATDRGVYRSEDSGRTWTRTLARPARYLAVDRANPRRVAAGCDGAVLLSEDGGLRWREVDSALPNRNFPRVGFAAGRLLAGTTGSGAFWLPLDSAGYAVAEVKSIARRAVEIPVAKAGLVGTPLELLTDGGFEDTRRFASRWTVAFTGRGRLEVASVGGAPSAGSRALRLRAVAADSAGSASARLQAPPRRFRVTGAARSAGATTEALIGVQGFGADGRPTGFVVLFDARNADTWRRFSGEVALPAGTENANLVATYAGSGSVSLDDVAFESIVEGATDPSLPLPTDLLANGDFESAGPISTDWTAGYLAKGALQIAATPVVPHSGSRALSVRNVGSLPAEGAAAYKLLKLPRRFRFEGFVRVEGRPGTALVAVQAFDIDGRQTTFEIAVDARSATSWQSFSTEIDLPDDAVTAYVVASFEGTGNLILDDLRLTTILPRPGRTVPGRPSTARPGG